MKIKIVNILRCITPKTVLKLISYLFLVLGIRQVNEYFFIIFLLIEKATVLYKIFDIITIILKILCCFIIIIINKNIFYPNVNFSIFKKKMFLFSTLKFVMNKLINILFLLSWSPGRGYGNRNGFKKNVKFINLNRFIAGKINSENKLRHPILLTKKNQFFFNSSGYNVKYYSTKSSDFKKNTIHSDKRFSKFFRRSSFKKEQYNLILNKKLLEYKYPVLGKVHLFFSELTNQFKPIFNPFKNINFFKKINDTFEKKLREVLHFEHLIHYIKENRHTHKDHHILFKLIAEKRLDSHIRYEFVTNQLKESKNEIITNLTIVKNNLVFNYKIFMKSKINLTDVLKLLYFYYKTLRSIKYFQLMIKLFFVFPLKSYDSNLYLNLFKKNDFNMNRYFDFPVFLSTKQFKLKQSNLFYKTSLFNNIYSRLDRIVARIV